MSQPSSRRDFIKQVGAGAAVLGAGIAAIVGRGTASHRWRRAVSAAPTTGSMWALSGAADA